MPQTTQSGTKRPSEDKSGGSPSNKRRTDSIQIPATTGPVSAQVADALQQWNKQQLQVQQQYRMAMMQQSMPQGPSGMQTAHGVQQGPSLSQFQNLYFQPPNAASSGAAGDPNSLAHQSGLMLGNLQPAQQNAPQAGQASSNASSLGFYSMPYNVAGYPFASNAPIGDPLRSPFAYQTTLHTSPMATNLPLYGSSQSLQLNTNQPPPRPPTAKQASKSAAPTPASTRAQVTTRSMQSAASTQSAASIQNTADDDDDDDTTVPATEGKEKTVRWSVKEIIELVDWVFADPERIIEVTNHPLRLFAKAAGVICTENHRPHRALKDRFRRLLEQRKLINEYDSWVRANGLDPTIHDLSEIEKRLERARQSGTKLPQLTPRAVKLWVRNHWIELFNKYFPLDGSRSHALYEIGTITPAMSGGGLPDTGYISDDSASEDDTDMTDNTQSQARIPRSARFTPPSSSTSQARPLPPESPARPTIAVSAPTPQETGSPLIRVKTPLVSAPTLAPLAPPRSEVASGKDKVDRGITVALGILSQQSAEPGLKRKATDFLSKILDEAAEDLL